MTSSTSSLPPTPPLHPPSTQMGTQHKAKVSQRSLANLKIGKGNGRKKNTTAVQRKSYVANTFGPRVSHYLNEYVFKNKKCAVVIYDTDEGPKSIGVGKFAFNGIQSAIRADFRRHSKNFVLKQNIPVFFEKMKKAEAVELLRALLEFVTKENSDKRNANPGWKHGGKMFDRWEDIARERANVEILSSLTVNWDTRGPLKMKVGDLRVILASGAFDKTIALMKTHNLKLPCAWPTVAPAKSAPAKAASTSAMGSLTVTAQAVASPPPPSPYVAPSIGVVSSTSGGTHPLPSRFTSNLWPPVLLAGAGITQSAALEESPITTAIVANTGVLPSASI